MPEGVVNVLKMIQVQKQQPQHFSVALGMREFFLKRLFKEIPIRQSGQAIVVRQVNNFSFRPLAVAYVLYGSGNPDSFSTLVNDRFGLLMNNPL